MKFGIQTMTIILVIVIIFALFYLWNKTLAINNDNDVRHKRIMDIDRRLVIVEKCLENKNKRKHESPIRSITFRSEFTKNPTGLEYDDISKSEAAKIMSKSKKTATKIDVDVDIKSDIKSATKSDVEGQLDAEAVEFVKDADSVFKNSAASESVNDVFVGDEVNDLADEIPSELPPDLINYNGNLRGHTKNKRVTKNITVGSKVPLKGNPAGFSKAVSKTTAGINSKQ